jgi:hypothetical protein
LLASQLISSDDDGFATIRGGDPVDVPDDLRELGREVEARALRARSA